MTAGAGIRHARSSRPWLFFAVTLGWSWLFGGRKLRRYKRRRKIERLLAWLGNFRRLVVRYERRVENYLGFVKLGCLVILLRCL